MRPPTIRRSCGTYRGMRAHIENGEQICSTCQTGARARSVEAERRAVLEDPHRHSDWQPLISALASLWTTPKDRT